MLWWILSTKNLLQSYNVHFNSLPTLRISRIKAYIKISPCFLFIDRNTVTDRLRKSKLSTMYFNECLSSAALILHLGNANIWCISLCIRFMFVTCHISYLSLFLEMNPSKGVRQLKWPLIFVEWILLVRLRQVDVYYLFKLVSIGF